jgi:hypothetical protein
MWMKNGERSYARWFPKGHAIEVKPTVQFTASSFCEQHVHEVYKPRLTPRVETHTKLVRLTLVAPIVRFNAFDFFATGVFSSPAILALARRMKSKHGGLLSSS